MTVHDTLWLLQQFKSPKTVQNTFNHKEKNQFNFWRTTVDNQNYPRNSVQDISNKFNKKIAKYNKNWKQTKGKWPENNFSKMTNEEE